MMWYMLLVSTLRGLSINLFSFLFGNILLISDEDMTLIVIVSTGIVGTLLVLHK